MIRHPARRWIVLLALAGSALASSPAIAQTSVPIEFPPPGSRWITRSLDRAGGSHLTTYTVLEPGSFQGRPGFRVFDNVGVQFFDRASFALMREFYDQLAKVDAGQAPQTAQRAAMKEFPHPFAWAAFGLTGVGR